MRITWEHIALPVTRDEMLALLDDWRWLVAESYAPLIVTSMGDMVLVDGSGHVFLVDTGGCELIEVAPSLAEFEKAISIADNARAWFLTNVLGDLLESGATLAANQCFGYKTPPILSGTTEPSNLEPTDISVHFSICGQIGRKTRGLPPGTVIDKVRIS